MNYTFVKKDLFYLNNKHWYFTFKNEVIGICIWTHTFNTFNYVNQSSRSGQFSKVDQLKQVDFFL